MLAALCAVAAGCGANGASDAASDTDQIRVAVQRLMESESVEDQCEKGVTERFVREVYVTLARCREANRPDGDDDEPDSARISATRIDGDRATTGVTLTSAKGARATGRVALAKVGATWKVDRLGVDFLRSIFQALPTEAATAEERLVLDCLAEASRDLSDRELRRVGNLLIGQQLEAESFPPAALRCIRRGSQRTQTA
ncbi:MAG: hypothetical protein ACLGI5_15600 [Thermoleophilia bacterium]